MSQADIETLRLGYEAASRGDWDAVLSPMDPDVVLKTIHAGTHRGRQKARPSGAARTIENRVGHLWTMRKGKPVRCETFPRREDALEAVEAEEPPTPASDLTE